LNIWSLIDERPTVGKEVGEIIVQLARLLPSSEVANLFPRLDEPFETNWQKFHESITPSIEEAKRILELKMGEFATGHFTREDGLDELMARYAVEGYNYAPMIFLSPDKYFPVGSHPMDRLRELAAKTAESDVIHDNFVEALRMILPVGQDEFITEDHREMFAKRTDYLAVLWQGATSGPLTQAWRNRLPKWCEKLKKLGLENVDQVFPISPVAGPIQAVATGGSKVENHLR
jgi:hypothetical protein